MAAPHSILGSPLTVCGLVEKVPQVLCLDLANVEVLVPIIHAIVMIVPCTYRNERKMFEEKLKLHHGE
jgi:hypothetical protein